LVAAVYFNDAAFNLDDGNPTTRAGQLDTLLVVVNIFIMCSIALLFAWTFLENVFRIRGRSVLARLVATNVVSLQANLQRHRTQFVDALKSGSVEDRISLKCFASAAEQCLSQDGIAPVRYMLEAAYIILKSYAGMKHDDVEAAQLELPLSTVTLCRQPSVRLRYRLQTASAAHLHRLRCAALQVLEFVGDRQATSWRAGLMQREKSVRQLTKQNSNKSVRHNSADAAAGAAGLWQTFRAEQIAKKVCEEIYSSLDAAKLHAWIYRYQADPGRLMGLFCLSAWLAPHIPDHALVGAYSRGVLAKTYRAVSAGMPRILIEVAFADVHGDDGSMAAWRSIMSRILESEEKLTRSEFKMLRAIEEKDHAPFLYWMMTERPLLYCTSAYPRMHVGTDPPRPFSPSAQRPSVSLLTALKCLRTTLSATSSRRSSTS
jgi:hypothetical protein